MKNPSLLTGIFLSKLNQDCTNVYFTFFTIALKASG